MTLGRLRIRNNIPTAFGAANIWLTTNDGIGFFKLAYWSFMSLMAKLSAHLILAARVFSFFHSSLAAWKFDEGELDEFRELADNLYSYSRNLFHSSRMSTLACSEPNCSTVGDSFSKFFFFMKPVW